MLNLFSVEYLFMLFITTAEAHLDLFLNNVKSKKF